MGKYLFNEQFAVKFEADSINPAINAALTASVFQYSSLHRYLYEISKRSCPY